MIASLDRELFILFNQLPHTQGLDTLAQAISGIGNAGAVWFVIALFLFFREERKGWHFFAPFVTAAAAASLASELLLKPLIGRFRPSIVVIQEIVVVGDMPLTYSFPSTHATLAWALAAVIAHEDVRLGRISYILAFLVSFSRVYLGVHYPLDVIAGGVLGWVIGQVCVRMYTPARKRR